MFNVNEFQLFNDITYVFIDRPDAIISYSTDSIVESKKVRSRLLINYFIPKRQDEVVVRHEVDTKTPPLLTFEDATRGR